MCHRVPNKRSTEGFFNWPLVSGIRTELPRFNVFSWEQLLEGKFLNDKTMWIYCIYEQHTFEIQVSVLFCFLSFVYKWSIFQKPRIILDVFCFLSCSKKDTYSTAVPASYCRWHPILRCPTLKSRVR